MTKIEFLQQLYNLLGGLPADERDDIIADFEEHFSVGTSEGKSEEQICSELGDPKNCAAQYLNDEPKKADAVYGAEKNGNPRYETKASDVIGASPRPQNARPYSQMRCSLCPHGKSMPHCPIFSLTSFVPPQSFLR